MKVIIKKFLIYSLHLNFIYKNLKVIKSLQIAFKQAKIIITIFKNNSKYNNGKIRNNQVYTYLYNKKVKK